MSNKNSDFKPYIPADRVVPEFTVTSVLIGASKPSQILDNVKAIENTHFTAEELSAIDEASL